ncbi:saccharopine dehydrogenase family protein [Oceanobacter mangrovi]|uniref:saccharopine dehydrogenase family protein n=1 Tax=Oceanobacter mangrovi TaxID=2862510 RepID=UPI001C8EA21B|nr:saccharopine dehydrogenase NADP-binding domain-containing protein [Oceanobacter mangrovi]
MEQKLDLLVFGATAFVGRLVVDYLARSYGAGQSLTWGIAGRNPDRLAQLKAQLVKDYGAEFQTLPILLADSRNEVDLKTLCQQARVIFSAVGPYAVHGDLLVRVCAETGTDYCDLTGEPQWIRRMQQAYEAVARRSGARIVNCIGFDSLPSDLGVLTLQQRNVEATGKRCDAVEMRLKGARGGFSGGTIGSLLQAIRELQDNPALKQELADPWSLCPADFHHSAATQSLAGATFHPPSGNWCMPFIMAPINERVVYRTNALLYGQAGAAFSYSEGVMIAPGGKGKLSARIATGVMAAGLWLLNQRLSRTLMERWILPKPGSGPTPAAIAAGFFDMRFYGYCDGKLTQLLKVCAQGDPGYGATSRMAGEAAVCLALDMVVSKTQEGGFYTPASLLGGALIERLQQRAGVTFEFLPLPSAPGTCQ